MAYYLHQVPGRLRVKTPFIKGSEERASEVQDFLKRLGGIESISTNIITGSLTIYYNPAEIDPETITNNLSRVGYFDRSKAITNDQYIFAAASSALSFAALFI
jgi:hypothetical protein